MQEEGREGGGGGGRGGRRDEEEEEEGRDAVREEEEGRGGELASLEEEGEDRGVLHQQLLYKQTDLLPPLQTSPPSRPSSLLLHPFLLVLLVLYPFLPPSLPLAEG